MCEEEDSDPTSAQYLTRESAPLTKVLDPDWRESSNSSGCRIRGASKALTCTKYAGYDIPQPREIKQHSSEGPYVGITNMTKKHGDAIPWGSGMTWGGMHGHDIGGRVSTYLSVLWL